MEDEAPTQKEPTTPLAVIGDASNGENCTATIVQVSMELPSRHEALSARADHSLTISTTQSHTTQHPGKQNGTVLGASFEPTGVLGRAPIQDQVHTVSSPGPPVAQQSKPTKQLRQAKVVHNSSNQARIDVLCDQERKTVTVDGGNTTSSQLSVLARVEELSLNNGKNRIWTESMQIGPDGKRKKVHRCNQVGCRHQDSTAQKARQHFVARHVEGAGWECPIEGCNHTRKHRRLDDLKAHHMVPDHDTFYHRGRESSEPLYSLDTGASHPYPTRAHNRRTQSDGHQIGPQRRNAGATKTGRDAHSNPLSMQLRSRRNTTASTAAAEQDESRDHVARTSYPPRGHPPVPVEHDYGRVVDMSSVSSSIAPIEGTSPYSPILTGDFHPSPSNERPSPFSPNPGQGSLFDGPTGRKNYGLSRDGYHLPAQTLHDWYQRDGVSPAANISMSSLNAQSGTHDLSQGHNFPPWYPYGEENLRMQRQDGLPGHDPPVHDATSDQTVYMDPRSSNSPAFRSAPGPPRDQWRLQQQRMDYGGGPGTSSHLSPSHIRATHSHVGYDNALQQDPHSWTSYSVDGTNTHAHGQPSTSYEPPRRPPNTSTSFRGDGGYPSNQVPSAPYDAFHFPSPRSPRPLIE